MIDFKKNIQILPNSLLSGLRSYLLLDFFDYPYLSVDINKTGTLFLNYYISGKEDNLNHIIIEISQERLNLLLVGDYTLKQAFANPENDVLYYITFNKNREITYLGSIDLNLFNEYNPIPLDYVIDYEFESEVQSVDLVLKSVQKGKILVDIYLQANGLKNILKYWALKSFLIPFSELVKGSLLNNSSVYTPYNVDKNINLGFGDLKVASLSTTMELNFNSDLFGVSNDVNNLSNLFNVFNSIEEAEIIKSFDCFPNKKFIAEYLRILNAIIKNDAVLKSKIAAPNDFYSETYISKKEAQIIKKIINEKMPSIEDYEDIRGYLLEFDFDKQEPTFGMSASLEDLKYRGKINKDLVNRINQKQFTFISKEYNFNIHTLYKPETSTSREQTIRTLIDIVAIDINEDNSFQ
jgi:hypothetical protein